MSSSLDETVVGPDTIPSERRPVPLSRGDVVGRYVVLQKLGAGGMGVVFAAYDPELDRKVALKLLHAQQSDQSRATEGHKRLLREAQALAKLSHPNVITVHDVGEHKGRVFLAMEFVDGETLTDYLKKDRSWREVVDVFAKAGAGLAAAHQKGLIHRDFKPDNVMIGKDGRVRVMDFGLARSDGDQDETAKPVAELDDLVQTADDDALSATLTRHGALVGTPAYMAPEQHLGEEVGPAADQFSFCVALYEGLYGTRPFEGQTLAALALDVTTASPQNPPSSSVPGWLKKVVRQGLSTDPGSRFSSMDALLAALFAGDARRRRNRIVAGLGVVTLGLAAGYVYDRQGDARQLQACEAEGQAIDEAWNEDVRQQLRDGLIASGARYAESTAEAVMPYFEAQADAWKKARTEACLDAHVRGSWDEEMLHRSTWCFDERSMELKAVVQELSQADDTAIQNAVTAAASLAQIDQCRDTTRLVGAPRPPDDREAFEAVRRALWRARALRVAAKYTEALEAAEAALAQAQTLEWPPLVAAAKSSVGDMLGRVGRYPEAEAMLQEAYFDAAEIGVGEVAAESATHLVRIVGVAQARYTEGRRWARHADVHMSVLGLGDEHVLRALGLDNLANLEREVGNLTEAQALQERALSIRTQALGAEHPWVATSLNNLAAAHGVAGDVESAKPLFERSLAIRKKVLGPVHPDVASSFVNLANVHRVAGDYDEARALNEKALAIYEHSLGPEHPYVAQSLNNLGAIFQLQADYPAALETHQRALAIRDKSLDSGHPQIAVSLANLGTVYQLTGDDAQAKAHFERSLALLEAALGPEHHVLAFPLTGLAEVALDQGRPADALALAERSAVLLEKPGSLLEDVAHNRFVLARALWETPSAQRGDRGRALDLAAKSVETFKASPGREEELAEVEAWLAAHGGGE